MTRHDDRGFTLIELIIGIAITGIVLTTVGAAFILGLKSWQGADDRMASSHDAQLLEVYLPSDVQSATSIDASSGATAGCTGTSGTNVLKLTWSETTATSGTTTYEVSYRRIVVGTENQLLRYSCSNSGAATSTIVGHHLDSATPPAVALCGDQVQMTVTVFAKESGTGSGDSYAFTVVGSRRSGTTTTLCPGATTTTTVATTTTTAATTTTTLGSVTKSSVTMKDNDVDGKIDQVVTVFSGTLDPSCSTGWTLPTAPAGASVGPVVISGSTATMTVNEGAVGTAPGAVAVSLAPASSCNTAAFTGAVAADAAPPVVVTVTSTGGNGKMEPNDTLVVGFSEPVKGAPSSTTVVETDGSPGVDTIAIGGMTNGTLTTGSNGYVNGNNTLTFSATVSGNSTATLTLTVVADTCSGHGCPNAQTGGPGLFVFDPATTLTETTATSPLSAVKMASNPAPGSNFTIF